jgi:DNA-binding transcriptional LysR family regulator
VTAAEDDLRAIAGLQGGTLKVGAFLSACNTFLPPALARFEQEHPDVELEFEQLEEPDALRKLRSGDLDVAVSRPVRRVYATWLHGRRVPAVARMVRYLAEAAEARLGTA